MNNLICFAQRQLTFFIMDSNVVFWGRLISSVSPCLSTSCVLSGFCLSFVQLTKRFNLSWAGAALCAGNRPVQVEAASWSEKNLSRCLTIVSNHCLLIGPPFLYYIFIDFLAVKKHRMIWLKKKSLVIDLMSEYCVFSAFLYLGKDV